MLKVATRPVSIRTKKRQYVKQCVRLAKVMKKFQPFNCPENPGFDAIAKRQIFYASKSSKLRSKVCKGKLRSVSDSDASGIINTLGAKAAITDDQGCY